MQNSPDYDYSTGYLMVVHPGLQKPGLQFWILDPRITPLQIFDSIIEFLKSGRMGNFSEAAKYFVLRLLMPFADFTTHRSQACSPWKSHKYKMVSAK